MSALIFRTRPYRAFFHIFEFVSVPRCATIVVQARILYFSVFSGGRRGSVAAESNQREVHMSLQTEVNWPNTGPESDRPDITRRFNVRRLLQRLGMVLRGWRTPPPAQFDTAP